MFTQLAAVVLLAVGSTSSASAADEPAAAEPVLIAGEALSDDLIDAGHDNGRLPAELLVEIESSAGCLLELEAAEQWLALEEQAAADGIELVARWCYRNISTQRATYNRNCPLTPAVPVDPEAAEGEDQSPVAMVRRCRVATAKPGNSNHGWGRAVDLKTAGRLLSCQSPEFEWLVDNAHLYGWVHPEWAACGEPKEEAWHWEWAGQPPPAEPVSVGPATPVKELAPWLTENEWANHVPRPADYREPNWVNAFLRGSDAS